jgi:two-component system, LuxR family, sensor kinase FixL
MREHDMESESLAGKSIEPRTAQFRNPLRRGHLKIGTRLTWCFIAIVFAMLVANVVAVWQFRRTATPSELLNEADQLSLAAMTVHLDVDTLSNRLAALADINNGADLLKESESLRRKFVADVTSAEQLLTKPGDTKHDPVILRTLQTLRVTLPSQIEKVEGLAEANEWPAVRVHLADQVQGLMDLSALLLERVDAEVSRQRAEALDSAQQVSRQLLMVLPLTALLTMLLAILLGWRVTRTITEPLSELHAGAEALARGELAIQLKVTGQDELTTVAKAFNFAAQQLRESYDQLRNSESDLREQANLLGLTQDAIFVADMQGVIKYWNRGAEEQYGWTAEQAVGAVAHELLETVFPTSREEVVSEVTRAGRWEGELLHTRKDGTRIVVACRLALQSDEQGAPVAILESNNDITDRKRAEEERERLRQLEADLAHINRVSMLGELAASIAHEVNQPLSGVVSNGSACLRWLAGEPPNLEEARETARRIVRDGKRAAEVIARIRALSKRAATTRERLDLNETIQDVLALAGDEAKKKSVIIRTQFADDLSPVSADRVQLQQVLLNLVMNAIEAMSSVGDRARELALTTRNLDADQVQVTVEDSGTGLDPDTMDKIFNPFYTTKPGGMGMGLSISRSILQAHGGRLWATAKDGLGTIFSFTLPTYHDEESNAGVAAV